MLYLVLCVIWYLLSLKKSIILKFLILTQICSVGLAMVSGMYYPVSNMLDLINVLFVFVVVYLFSNPFGQKIENVVFVKNAITLKKVTYTMVVISLFVIVLLLFIGIKVLPYLSQIGEFRYGYGKTNLFMSLGIDGAVGLVLQFLSALSVILITLHFYYLLQREYLISIFCLIGTLSIPMYGFISLTRSNVILYISLYLFNLACFYPTLGYTSKKFVKTIGGLVLLSILMYFAFMTNARFGDRDYQSTMTNQWIINRPNLASLISYFSQWYQNSMQVLSDVESRFNWGYFSFSPIYQLLQKIGLIDVGNVGFGDWARNKYISIIPNQWYLFNGLPAVLYIDFGYLGTLLFAIVFNRFSTKFISKFKHRPTIGFYVLIFALLMLPGMSVMGFYLKDAFYFASLCCVCVFYLYFKK